jgi:D-beta-D-heptose 7-phosphate kinase/D-beta-D-heptose 1-phosphate adenosyltransferase
MAGEDSVKHVPLEEFIQRGHDYRAAGRRTVFTSGVFDIVHRGHLSLLRAARALGDVLFVAINSDASVSRKKGPLRPINGDADRAFLLAQLEVVDLVTVFDEPGNQPVSLIELLAPDVVVKSSGEWMGKERLGEQALRATGGQSLLLGHAPGYSTSSIIKRIVERYGPPAPGPDGAGPKKAS